MGIVTAQISVSVDGFVGHLDEEMSWKMLDRLANWVYDLPAWRKRQGMAGGTRDDNPP